MARLRHKTSQVNVSDDASLRIRAAWLYYSHGLTQKGISERLGLSRGTVIRLLGDAVARGEVQIWISEGEKECIELALQLENALGLDEALVVPEATSLDIAHRSVGLALGQFLSEVVADGMTIGVGWGRTLTASLSSLRPSRHRGVKIVSLLGGVVEVRDSNPVEYAWRIASQFGGDCYLFVAPAFADSVTTKTRLIEKCGLDKIYGLAASLDLAIVSVGDIGSRSTSLSASIVSNEDLKELIDMGCVGDVLCNFLDAEGKSVAASLEPARHVDRPRRSRSRRTRRHCHRAAPIAPRRSAPRSSGSAATR